MFSIEALRGRSLPSQPRVSTGIESLDAVLGGGLRLGRLVEISGKVGSGRSSLALSLALRCLGLGQAVAWVESQPAIWPLPSLEAGLPLENLLRVLVPAPERLRALELLLSTPGAVAVAVLDLANGDVAPHQLVKLHRLAERSASLVLFLTERPPGLPALGPLIDVRLHLAAPGGDRAPTADVFQRTLDIQVLRHKQGPTQGSFTEVLHGPDRLRLRSSL